MAARSEMWASPAYAALTPSGKQALHLIVDEIERNGGGAVTMARSAFMKSGMCKAATSFGCKQLVALGFVSVSIHGGLRRANVFALTDGWRALDAVEAARLVKLAKLPKPQRAAAPKSVKPPKSAPKSVPPKPVEQPRMVRVTLPKLSFMG